MRLARLMRRSVQPSPDAADLCVTADARTHVGRVRQVNEDRLLDRSDRNLWAIADGMGGHAGGDIAATIAIAALDRCVGNGPATLQRVTDALHAGNHDIGRHNMVTDSHSGATIVVLARCGNTVDILWAGDSRAYRFRDGACQLLTKDHSVVQDLVDAGLLAANDADRHPSSHVVTRALGAAPAVEIAHCRTDITRGDVFLLCSDGFSRGLTRERLAIEASSCGFDAGELLLRAVERDGTDNVSLIVIQA